jgi:hypothetical protein
MKRTKRRLLMLLASMGAAAAISYWPGGSAPAQACYREDTAKCECPWDDNGSLAACTFRERCWSEGKTGEIPERKCSCEFEATVNSDCPKQLGGGNGETCGDGQGGCYRDNMCVPCGY